MHYSKKNKEKRTRMAGCATGRLDDARRLHTLYYITILLEKRRMVQQERAIGCILSGGDTSDPRPSLEGKGAGRRLCCCSSSSSWGRPCNSCVLTQQERERACRGNGAYGGTTVGCGDSFVGDVETDGPGEQGGEDGMGGDGEGWVQWVDGTKDEINRFVDLVLWAEFKTLLVIVVVDVDEDWLAPSTHNSYYI
ncbi:hypothetical protein BDN70DRAFT_902314 [Pholiota conissans]|uniref:Uncharacterized protein n=1 Tax=Pholiota conissans TaxID=109636 RepID=A0A9P5YLU5_9AGAR|nr:hypothetical protein BDN70DRAFT_902314 [Pholiota conissans]